MLNYANEKRYPRSLEVHCITHKEALAIGDPTRAFLELGLVDTWLPHMHIKGWGGHLLGVRYCKTFEGFWKNTSCFILISQCALVVSRKSCALLNALHVHIVGIIVGTYH